MNKKRFLPVGKLKCWLEVNGFRRLLTAVTRRQRRRKKLGPFLALRSVSFRKSTLQFSATQPPNELFLSEDVRIFARGCDIYGASWLRMTEGAGLAVSDWEN